MFGAVKLTSNAIKSNLSTMVRLEFDGKESRIFANNYDRNVVICGVDNTSSRKVENRRK